MRQYFKKAHDSVKLEGVGVLYNILIEFGVPMTLVRLIKMCLNEAYIKVRIDNYQQKKLVLISPTSGGRSVGIVRSRTRATEFIGKRLSDSFPVQAGLKQGVALSLLLFNFALEYAVRKVQETR
jgi:hypothetical protein